MARRVKEFSVDHIRTELKINNNKLCATCPYKVYNNHNDCITFGAGNIYANNIFVFSNYDTYSKAGYESLITKFRDYYDSTFGMSLFETAYVTRLVKCHVRSNYDLYGSAIDPCSNFLNYEVDRLYGRNVIFLGSAYDDYANNCSKIGNFIHNKYIHTTYSAGILFHDNKEIIDKFTKHLKSILI